jgi:methylated-DNA-protein-cysteine methyltransferase-like protein
MSRNPDVGIFCKSGTMPRKKTHKIISPKKKAAKKISRPAVKNNRNPDSFFELVYSVVRQIPRGRVSSYGAIAEYIGTKLTARMVGWAMNAAGSADPPVPAHRVVNRNGMLSGKHHFATPTLMEELLRNEKVKVKDDTVVDFEELFWNPSEMEY